MKEIILESSFPLLKNNSLSLQEMSKRNLEKEISYLLNLHFMVVNPGNINLTEPGITLPFVFSFTSKLIKRKHEPYGRYMSFLTVRGTVPLCYK